MRILIAEDDETSRLVLQTMLESWGHELVVASNGDEAWRAMQAGNAPYLAILDRLMPDMDGAEICQRARKLDRARPLYIILLTVLGRTEDIVVGLEAGADDYVAKPFSCDELRARIRVAERMIELQCELSDRLEDLEDALAHVKTLQGILPICMYCRRIRADEESWEQLEIYILDHSDVEFSHGLCPQCAVANYEELVPPTPVAEP